MTLSTPVLLIAAGLWVTLLVGCVLFVLLAMRFRGMYVEQHLRAEQLDEKLRNAKSEKKSKAESNDLTSELEQLHKTVQELEQQLASAADPAEGGENDPNLVSRLRLDKLNDKYESLQALWESTNQDLIRAEAKIAELLGVNAALSKERELLQRKLETLASEELDVDAASMREVIINFTEDSRELLQSIEELSAEKEALKQQVADMEKGGKGSAGKVIGLQRKLDEAEAQIAELESLRQ